MLEIKSREKCLFLFVNDTYFKNEIYSTSVGAMGRSEHTAKRLKSSLFIDIHLLEKQSVDILIKRHRIELNNTIVFSRSRKERYPTLENLSTSIHAYGVISINFISFCCRSIIRLNVISIIVDNVLLGTHNNTVRSVIYFDGIDSHWLFFSS